MTEQQRDLVDLAKLISDWRLSGCNHRPFAQTCSSCLCDRLLESEWLADHDARIRQEAKAEFVGMLSADYRRHYGPASHG